MSFLFGQNATQTTETRTPTEIHDITMSRLQRRNDLEDGYYRINTKFGQYVGDIRNKRMNGHGRYTWRNGRFQEGVFNDGNLVSGTFKTGKQTLTGTFNEDHPELLDCQDGQIDFGNGITFKGFVQNNEPIRGEYTVAANTSVEFIAWRGIRSGHKGLLTRDGDWWVQTYTAGPVRELRSKGLNPTTLDLAPGEIKVTFYDGSVYTGRQFDNDEYDVWNVSDRFTESSNIVSEFRNWSNYQLDQWLVSHRGLDHFPNDFFINIRSANVTGAQILEFDEKALRNLGLCEPIFQSQMKTELARFTRR